MARIAGVDIPRDKRVVISLTYIFGIGKTTSQKVSSWQLVFLKILAFAILQKTS